MGVISDVCGQSGGLDGDSVVSSIASTPNLPTNQPVTPMQALLPGPLTAGPPILGLSLPTDLDTQDSATLEQFEASSLAQEVEDRLAQLVMDEELSDARLAQLVVGEEIEIGGSRVAAGMDSDPTVLGLGGGVEGVSDGGRLSLLDIESSKATRDWSDGGGGDDSADGGGDDGGMVTSYETTRDPKETERLENSSHVAR